MKTHKILALILAIAMLSSVMAFAVVAEEGIAPHIDCDHTYGTVVKGPFESSSGGTYYKVYCDQCGRFLYNF